MAEMAYYYWTRKGIRPSVFSEMSPEEKLVVRAFFELEVEEIGKRIKAGVVCPQLL